MVVSRIFSWYMLILFSFSLLVILAIPQNMHLLVMEKATYLPIHTFLEFIGIFCSLSIFLIGWATYKNVDSHRILFLSVSSLAVALFDFGHTMSFAGMPKFVTDSEPNKAIYFWLAGRLTDAVAFLFIALSIRRADFQKWRWPALGLSLLVVGLVYYMVLLRPYDLPLMFIKGTGLTALKIELEWAAILMSLAAAVLFFKEWQNPKVSIKEDLSNKLMTCGCVLFAMGGVLFCLYREVDDLYNLAGHIYKTFAFVYIFSAVFLVCVKQPYQEMRRLGIEASAANESKSRFLANVSHEFRTPLGVISGFSELFQSKELDDESKKWVSIIHRNSEQLRVLIDDLLDLTKAESGKMPISSSVFEIRSTINETVQGLGVLAEQKGIKISLDVDPNVPNFVQLDSLRLKQILINIIGNAIKFTAYGTVKIYVEDVDGHQLKFSVQDTGTGIPKESTVFLFRPFSQVDDSFTRRFGGTGLGLALSKKLAELLGGDLWLERSEPGIGSLFVFKVAYVTSQNQTKITANNTTAIPTLEGLRILVAEDSQDIRSLVKLYLRDTQAQVLMVENGALAVQAVKRQVVDLILMDIQMPEMDGITGARMIRELKWTGPIIAMTAHAHESERNHALKNGFDEYLVKPFKKSELIHMISKFKDHSIS